MGAKNKNHTCCQCAFWNMAFDNSCSERVRLYGDFSNQAPDKPACKLFEKGGIMKRDEIIPINIPIYNTCLWVFFGTMEECAAALRKNDVSERGIKSFLDKDNVQLNGMYLYNTEENVSLLWMPKVPVSIENYASLVHEIEHFVFYLFERIGMEHTSASDEAYAYLMGHVFAEIDCAINALREDEHKEEKAE